MLDLRTPLARDVLEAGRTDDGEADEEHVCLGVGQGPESVIVLLTGRVPEAQAHRDPVADHGRGVVVKNWKKIEKSEKSAKLKTLGQYCA